MNWNVIGHSSTGTAHLASGRGCEDALQFAIVPDLDDRDVLIFCASDGAGSAKFAAMAAEFTTGKTMEALTTFAITGRKVTEADIYRTMEDVYQGLVLLSSLQEAELSEYSCTVLGGIVSPNRTVFFQLGDGAIITRDGSNQYKTVWWPFEGEYLNATHFVVDDPRFGNLKVQISGEPTSELCVITDGLQMLSLNTETKSAHQPFFSDLFNHLRQASRLEQITALQNELAEFLDSDRVNSRTDDDKTLLLALCKKS